jgi:hypothetical protein
MFRPECQTETQTMAGPYKLQSKWQILYAYFSDVDEVYEKQLQERTSVAARSAIVTLSDPEAVLILVAVIRQHGISAAEILALPEIKKSKITLSAVKGFMAYHGLLKKTPDFRP